MSLFMLAGSAQAAPLVAIEGRVLLRDFMPIGCAEPPCGMYPRIRPISDVEVVASTRSGRILSVAEVTPNGNFFLRLPRGRHILNVPSLGISREITVGRKGVRGLRLNLDVF
jgi:hypothetical protein